MAPRFERTPVINEGIDKQVRQDNTQVRRVFGHDLGEKLVGDWVLACLLRVPLEVVAKLVSENIDVLKIRPETCPFRHRGPKSALIESTEVELEVFLQSKPLRRDPKRRIRWHTRISRIFKKNPSISSENTFGQVQSP